MVQPAISPYDPETYTVEEFCRRHNVSRSYFYEVLLPEGAAPAMTTLGRHRSITREAAAAWRAHWTGRTLPSRPKRNAELP
jgi:excisionase family DNA binding protein